MKQEQFQQPKRNKYTFHSEYSNNYEKFRNANRSISNLKTKHRPISVLEAQILAHK